MGKRGVNVNRLTAKDFKFAQLILKDVPPAEAAIQCGYSSKGAGPRVAAMRLLDKPGIANYLENERKRLDEIRRKETEVDDLYITKTFKEILNRCMQARAVMVFDYENKELVHAKDESTGELLYQFDSAGAIKAAENLAKHIGYYELDNKQKQTVIKIGAVNNVANFFFADEEEDHEGGQKIEIG